jgi:hypothetical protein
MTDKSSSAAVKGFLQKRFQFLLGALLLLDKAKTTIS